MNTATLIDVIVLILVYVGLSLACEIGRWLIGMASPPAADRLQNALTASGPRRAR